MECRDAQFYLRLRKHAGDELGPEVAAALDGHLAVCPACAAEARASESFDRAMASAMRAVPMPAELRERLVSHVAGQQGGILRRRMYRAGAAVAAALLLVGVGLGVFSNTRPKPDTQAMVDASEAQLRNPEAATKRWLADQKLPDTLPLPFDFDLFMTYGHEFQGKVPVVVFRSPSGPGFAKVYIFREDGLIDTRGLRDAHASDTQARVFTGEGQARNVKYVVVFTGLDLQPFLRNAGGPPLIG